jgi:hypothetical protein
MKQLIYKSDFKIIFQIRRHSNAKVAGTEYANNKQQNLRSMENNEHMSDEFGCMI